MTEPISPLEELVAACESAFADDSMTEFDDDEDVSTPGTGITFGMIRRARLALLGAIPQAVESTSAFPLPFRVSSRFDPAQTLRIVGYHVDQIQRGLATGHFRPVVRHAQMFAELIRVAAIAEERDAERNASVPLLPPHGFRTMEDLG